MKKMFLALAVALATTLHTRTRTQAYAQDFGPHLTADSVLLLEAEHKGGKARLMVANLSRSHAVDSVRAFWASPGKDTSFVLSSTAQPQGVAASSRPLLGEGWKLTYIIVWRGGRAARIEDIEAIIYKP